MVAGGAIPVYGFRGEIAPITIDIGESTDPAEEIHLVVSGGELVVTTPEGTELHGLTLDVPQGSSIGWLMPAEHSDVEVVLWLYVALQGEDRKIQLFVDQLDTIAG